MRVEFSAFVESDLQDIGEYIALDDATRAVSFIREIRESMRRLGRNPYLYRLRPEIGEEARVAIVGRYIVLFRIVNSVVRVERVVHGARDLSTLFGEQD